MDRASKRVLGHRGADQATSPVAATKESPRSDRAYPATAKRCQPRPVKESPFAHGSRSTMTPAVGPPRPFGQHTHTAYVVSHNFSRQFVGRGAASEPGRPVHLAQGGYQRSEVIPLVYISGWAGPSANSRASANDRPSRRPGSLAGLRAAGRPAPVLTMGR